MLAGPWALPTAITSHAFSVKTTPFLTVGLPLARQNQQFILIIEDHA
jgi:hypothetical protein